MHIEVMDRSVSGSIKLKMVPTYDDPLDRDEADDAPIVTTRRALIRLVLVAAETASHFAREKVDVDPVAWMLAPRRLFDGRAAIDACVSRDECLRAILLHGLSMGLDADPEELDALADDEDEDVSEVRQASDMAHDDGPRPRLWTSFMVDRRDGGAVQAFDAVIADSRPEAEDRLRASHEGRFAGELEIVEGFDARLPLAAALVAPAIASVLEQVAKDPGSPLAQGLSVSVRQRFAA